MKIRPIIRIVVCSVLFVALLVIMLSGLGLSSFIGSTPSGDRTVLERRVGANQFSNLEIDWAAGSITITRGTSPDTIAIFEGKDSKNPYTLSTEFDDATLKISYGASGLNLGNLSGKDLVIQVPDNWTCHQLEINGAALDIDIKGASVVNLELNGAANTLSFDGKLNDLSVAGASNSINMTVTQDLRRAGIEGMGCKLNLTLPSSLGFKATLEGLGVSFESDLKCTHKDNSYAYGNEACKIDVSGLGCKVSVNPS